MQEKFVSQKDVKEFKGEIYVALNGKTDTMHVVITKKSLLDAMKGNDIQSIEVSHHTSMSSATGVKTTWYIDNGAF